MEQPNTEIEKSQQGLTVITTPSGMMAGTVIGQNGQALVDILKASIENVQKDPAYIPQANSIREHISEIINLAKVEAQTIVAINNLNGH